MRRISTLTASFWIIVLATGRRVLLRRRLPCGRDPRGGRAGHPRGRPVLEGRSARRWLVVRRRERGQDRHHQPGHPGPLDRRRESRFAGDQQGARLPPRLRAQRPAQHLRDRLQTMVFAAAEPERDQLRIANNVSWLERAQIKTGDPVYWPGSWTYSDSKHGRPGDNSNTQYALLGSARRQRGRRSGQARRLGPGAQLLGAEPEARRELGLHARLGQPDRQHDLRGHLEPDHLRPPAVPGPGVPRG